MIYLDSAATSEPHMCIRDFKLYHNPSSRTHIPGLLTKKQVEIAREELLKLLPGAKQVVFTSGATESLMIVIRGLEAKKRRKWCVSPVEHKAALNQVIDVSDNINYFELTKSGEVIADSCEVKDSVCVSMLVNNETGIVNRGMAEMKALGASVTICDATQGIGKVDFDMEVLGADFIIGSSHKFHGPMGCGFIAVKNSDLWDELKTISTGGKQEGGIRSGTLNATAIIQTGKVCSWIRLNSKDYIYKLSKLRNQFEETLSAIIECEIIGSNKERAPHISSVLINGVDNEAVISSVKEDLAISSGSACTSHSFEPSHVLLAMLGDSELVDNVIRVSFGYYNTLEEVTTAAQIIAEKVNFIKSFEN